MKKPYFSFVITTKNEEKNISNLIDSIINQTFRDYEVIIVDNFSTDKTRKIIEEYNFIKFYQKGPERGHQRSHGVINAQGKYIIWPDADHILDSMLLDEIYQITKSNNPNVCFFIPERIIVNNYFNKLRNFERSFYDATPIDCPRVIPRDIFLKIINEQKNSITFNAGPDDWDIYNYCEIYSKFRLTKHVMQHNETNLTFLDYLKKKKKYMSDMSGFFEKWPNHHLNKYRFGLMYRLIFVYFRKNKLIYLCKNIHIFIPMLFLRIIVGIIYLFYK